MATERPVNNDLLYFKQQLNALLVNTSRTVKTICILVIIGYVLSFWDEGILFLGVTPGYLLPPSFKIWTAFTFCFFEVHFWEVLIDILIVGLCGKLMEPLWGAMEMVNFFIIVNFGIASIGTFMYLVLFMYSHNPDLLFRTHLYGLAGYVAAVTVVAKQIIPDIQIVKTPFGKITNRNIPLITVCFCFIFWLSGLFRSTYPIMITLGILISWIYLRFYQRHSNGSRGDMTDSFNFASFFPNVMQPAVSVLANTIYNFLIRIKVCKRNTKSPVSSGPSNTRNTAESLDNERRRQIALKALSERLNKSEQPLLQPMLPVKLQSPKKSTDVIISIPSALENAPSSLPANKTRHPIIDM